MDKYTKIISFDVGTERPTIEYCEQLESELGELKDKIENATCHQGHKHLPLTLWDCPVCVQIEKKKLEAKLAETTKTGEELIDERDDIIAFFKVDNAILEQKNQNLKNIYQAKHLSLENDKVELQRQVKHLMRQVDKLRKTGTSVI